MQDAAPTPAAGNAPSSDTVQTPSRGVLYIAQGAAHVEVARRSALSVKRHNPQLGTAIYCGAADDTAGFDIAEVQPEGMKRPKIELLSRSPFEQTLYLDNDTLVRSDLSSLFDLLDRFDLCGAHVALWHRPRHQKTWKTPLPDAFPEINCGVLLYRRNEATDRFFADWGRAFAEAGFNVDQVTFRETLWHSDLRFYVLPPQFNKRVFEGSEVIYSDQPRPRILHLPLLRPQKNPVKAWFANRLR